jgi:hypothetical protein
MAPQSLSIQSFFQASRSIFARNGITKQPSNMSNSGDGFTSAEVNTILHPSTDKFLDTNRRLHMIDLGT